MENTNVSEIKLPWDIYNKHFLVLKLIDHQLSYSKFNVKCLHCVGFKTLCADTRSTSNLRKHLARKHAAILNEIDSKDECHPDIEASDDKVVPLKRSKLMHGQLTLKESLLKKNDQILSKNNKNNVTQSYLDTMIQKLIINQCLPFSLVESEDFKVLIQEEYPNLKVISRPTLMKRLDSNISTLLKNMKENMSHVIHITTTADCWSIFKRSYISITGHWINSSFERVSCLLAIKRLEGKHTYDILAKTMKSVYTEFDINNKISHTTIDNWSNFVKSFKVYSKDTHYSQNKSNLNSLVNEIIELSDEKESIEVDNNTSSNEVDDISEGVTILPINDILLLGENNYGNDEFENLYNLPKHHRCAAHSLNLIATKDSETALLSSIYKKQSRLTFAKINEIFNKQNRSTQVADIIKSSLGVYLKTPNITKWNSLYDSIKFICSCFKSNTYKFNTMCDEIKVTRINKNDFEFMEEYCIAMEPLAISLDILQGENNMYFGYLLPVITELMTKIEKLRDCHMHYCQPLISSLHEGITKRFGQLFNDEFLIIAATSHPFFKTEWINDENKKQTAVNLLREAIISCYSNELVDVDLNISSSEHDNDEDINSSFFSWLQKKHENVTIENELRDFLNTSPTKRLDTLTFTPTLKKVFIKYNTPLPSIAPIERVFSVGGTILSKKRGKMSDDYFEKTMLLKSNGKFWN